MSNKFVPTNSASIERRADFLSETIINSAIDMEAALGAVQAIVYMQRHNVPMDVALRVLLKQAERRRTTAWQINPTCLITASDGIDRYSPHE